MYDMNRTKAIQIKCTTEGSVRSVFSDLYQMLFGYQQNLDPDSESEKKKIRRARKPVANAQDTCKYKLKINLVVHIRTKI